MASDHEKNLFTTVTLATVQQFSSLNKIGLIKVKNSSCKVIHQNTIAQKLEGMLGYLAWSVVCYLTLSAQPTDTTEGILRLISIVIGLLLFIVCFYLTTRDDPYNKTRENLLNNYDSKIRRLGFFGQLITMIALRVFNDPGPAANVLIAIALAAQAPICFSRLVSVFWVIGLIILDLCLHLYAETPEPFLVVAISGAFQLLAFRMAQRVIQEINSHNQIAMLNRELIAMQELLEQSSKQSERLRISRDLHDGLGHNLTALILKLQYLTYISPDENSKKCSEEAYQLSRRLLDDVRETVHQMREGSDLKLKDALDALITQVPSLNIQLDFEAETAVPDAAVAEALFRCVQESITNTLKHSDATNLKIHVAEGQAGITLNIQDNGSSEGDITEGNGIKGMRERIESLKGRFEFTNTQGFNLNIYLPVRG